MTQYVYAKLYTRLPFRRFGHAETKTVDQGIHNQD